jgi:hypothetical protein
LLLLPQVWVQGIEAVCKGSKDDAQLSYTDCALKQQRLQESIGRCKTISMSFSLPMSCVVERLFLQAKLVFNPRRRSLHIKTIEALLFLNQNRELLNVAMVAVIVNERNEEVFVMVEEHHAVKNGEDGAEDDDWE